MKRTNTCGELREANIGQKVTLHGWVDKARDHGGVFFINLRDRYGITQLVVKPDNQDVLKKAESLRRESVIEAKGEVLKRESVNDKMPTGQIEVLLSDLTILSLANPLPVEYKDLNKITEDSRLKYRYLDLRREDMQKNIITRYKVCKATRDFLDSESFIEIETPILAKSTPEGARDYLVPSRTHPGNFFALPQSPQQYKQLLMVSGFDRYFQIVKCFRDEDLRADRQPEFTQIDIETSFLDPVSFQSIIEGLTKHIFKTVVNQDIQTPFPRMTFEDAMNNYGIDRPDTRFDLKIQDFGSILSKTELNIFKDVVNNGGSVKGIIVENADFSKKKIKKFEELTKIYDAKGLAWLKSSTGSEEIDGSIAKFITPEIKSELESAGWTKGSYLFIIADHKHHVALTALGQLRLKLGKELNLIDENKNNLLWIVDFPMLEYDEEEDRHVAVHHPFTSPKPEWFENFDKEPDKAIADAYDLVWNGVEIAGGSKRIHQADIQQRVFNMLGIGEEEANEKFSMLLEAFKYGAPPHCGIAFGLDRLAALLTKNDSIREVIAFPKNKACSALMEGAPSEVDDKQLEELSVKSIKLEKQN